MLLLSFVVPFYNVEPYIEECIRSLYNQDISRDEYEVICIDDCSPDGSRAIVEELQKEYPTLQLYSTPENIRQGGARNIGIEKARGKYIWFVDADDSIESNSISELLSLAEKNDLDILRVYPMINGKTEKMIEYGPCTGSQLVFDAPMQSKSDQRCSSVCMGLIKKTLLTDNNIRFTEKVQFEDDDYAYMFYAYAKKVLLLPKALYYVRLSPNSSTRHQYTVQTLYYLSQQVKRLIQKERILHGIDCRWSELIKTSIKWTVEGQILPAMSKLSNMEQQKFYRLKLGHIRGLSKYVSIKTYLSLRHYWLYKIFNKI